MVTVLHYFTHNSFSATVTLVSAAFLACCASYDVRIYSPEQRHMPTKEKKMTAFTAGMEGRQL